MKKIILSLAALLVLSCVSQAQVNLNIMIQKPTPTTLSAWQTNPAVIQVIISNTSPNPYAHCILSIQIKDQNGNIVAKTKDTDPSMPRFDVPAAPNTLILSGNQLINYNAVWIDPKIKTSVTTTNSLPEGDYQICMSIVDPYGNQIVNGIEKCSDVSIVLPEPPQLIMPEDKQVLANLYPQFFWTPVNLSSYYINIVYRLKIVKLFQGQTAKDGINTNTPVFDKMITGNSYQYLPSDFNLGTYSGDFENLGYAWQIQVYNGTTNQPIPGIGQDGKSEVWTILPPSADPTTLKLISPFDNSIVSPVSGVYKFTWDASKQKKAYSGFVLKFVEIKQGQTPDIAMLVNEPVYSDNSLPAERYISETQNVFYDQQKYAWQIWTYSNSYGGIIDTSKIWSFTVQSNFVENLTSVSPLNNTVCFPDTVKHSKLPGYSFDWNSNGVKKAITSYRFIIAPVIGNQTSSEAINLNTHIYDSTSSYTFIKLFQDQTFLESNINYAWIVLAYSTAYKNALVAKTEPQLFTVSGAEKLAENVSSLFIGKYKIKVNSVTSKSITNFSGTGEINLWNNGPVMSFNFKNLKIRQFDTLAGKFWKVTDGEIWENVSADIHLTTYIDNSPDLSAKISIEGLRLRMDYSKVYGTVKLLTPFIKIENNIYSNLVIQCKDWLNIDPVKKLTADTLFMNTVLPEYKMFSPYNYYFDISDKTFLSVKNNEVGIGLCGAVTLPDIFKDNKGNPISFKLNYVPGFKLDYDNTNQVDYYKLTSNNDLLCSIERVNINPYLGIVSVTQGSLCFDQQKFGLAPIPFGPNDGVYFSSNGFQSNIAISYGSNKSNKNNNVTYRGYQFGITDLRLSIVKSVYTGQNYLKGNVTIPFINQQAFLILNLGSNGVIGGDINAGFVGNWVLLHSANAGSVQLQLNINAMSYITEKNSFVFNGYFKFINSAGNGISTDQLAISNVYIDSLGQLSVFGTDAQGWIALNQNKTGKFNGWPVTISKFRINQFTNAYNFSVGGNIVLADNLSKPGGTDFVTGFDMPKAGYHGGLPPLGDSLQTDPIAVSFGNTQSDFGCTVKWFEGDPVYGKGFLALTNVNLHTPGDFQAASKILIGKTDNGNGFSYWYVESKVTLPAPGVETGVLDIAVRSFEGRLYSHMKHSGTDINADSYVPSQGNTFGIYGNLGVESFENDGITFWGTMGFEVVIGPGFTSTLTGNVNILSSGWGNADGMVKGTAVITVSTSPKLFDAYFDVDVNLKNALCAHGSLKMHIDSQNWSLSVGTPLDPVTASLLCSSSGYNGYFTIDKSSTAFGIGYNFDTGDQEWGEGVGCWGRAWGGINAGATINYNPFQFTGTASLYGSAKIGVYIHVMHFKGKITLLSGEASANLMLTFPDPVCFAGRIHAELCVDPCPWPFSCDMCLGATLKIRYKNGNFDLSDNCN